MTILYPDSLDALDEHLRAHPDAEILYGINSALPPGRTGILVRHLPGVASFGFTDEHIQIGAGLLLPEVSVSQTLWREGACLSDACAGVPFSLENTPLAIGDELAALPISSDFVIALLALGGEVCFVERSAPDQARWASAELIVQGEIPAPHAILACRIPRLGRVCAYVRAVPYAKVGCPMLGMAVALGIAQTGEIVAPRIVIGASGHPPIRCSELESQMDGASLDLKTAQAFEDALCAEVARGEWGRHALRGRDYRILKSLFSQALLLVLFRHQTDAAPKFWLSRISQGGAPEIADTGIKVASVIERLNDGCTVEEVLAQFPALSYGDVFAALEWVRKQIGFETIRF